MAAYLKVACNAIYKKEDNFNCKLTPLQAIQLAAHLLAKAHAILEQDREGDAVHLWNTGKNSEVLNCGIDGARKGQRRQKAP